MHLQSSERIAYDQGSILPGEQRNSKGWTVANHIDLKTGDSNQATRTQNTVWQEAIVQSPEVNPCSQPLIGVARRFGGKRSKK